MAFWPIRACVVFYLYYNYVYNAIYLWYYTRNQLKTNLFERKFSPYCQPDTTSLMGSMTSPWVQQTHLYVRLRGIVGITLGYEEK